jgi:hypothetical protein
MGAVLLEDGFVQNKDYFMRFPVRHRTAGWIGWVIGFSDECFECEWHPDSHTTTGGKSRSHVYPWMLEFVRVEPL